MIRVLITGDRGFVGRHLRHECQRRGWQVTGLDTERSPGEDCRAWFHQVAPPHFDLVLHCAALVGGRVGIEGDPLRLATTDLAIDADFFAWCGRYRPGHVVYFSSSAAYPVSLQTPTNHLMLNERQLVTTGQLVGQPDNTYGWVKVTGERLAEQLREDGVNVMVYRPFSGYGADQDPAYPFRAFMQRAIQRQNPFEVWGDGKQVRDWIHVDDIVATVLDAFEAGLANVTMNLGWGRPTSMDELAEMFIRAAGYQAEIVHSTDKPSGVHWRVSDPDLLYDFRVPKISLERAVEEALR